MNSVKISAIIITLNEEKNIQGCIDSIRDVADEIIVVDSFSTDRTEEICRNYAVKFIQHAWEGYGQQKNRGNAQAGYDYILSLDADERLSNELKKAILNVKKNWEYDVYSFNRLNHFQNRKMKYISYPDRQLRLFDRRRTRWNENKVHEGIIISNETTVKHIKKDIIHYSYQNIHEQIARLNNYSTLSACHSFELGKKPSIFKLIFSPAFLFIKNYFFRLGFLDGVLGFIICINTAHYTFLKYAKLLERYKTNMHNQKQRSETRANA
jgi:glycosyltransferase involved in cell wall biosynthesis